MRDIRESGRADGEAGIGFQAAVSICLLVLATGVAAQWEARFALDDALMFARYADNLLSGEGFAWNAGEGSVYGPTSPAFVLIVAAMRALFGGSPSLGVQAASLLCGAGMVAVTIALAAREGGARGSLAALWVLAGLSAWTESLSAHFASGMDTTFGMAVVGAYLLVARGLTLEEPSARAAIRAAAAGGLLFIVRPDALVYAVVVPAVVAVSARGRERAPWLGAAVGAAAVAVAFACAAWIWLGTPLPLSFYTKSAHGYGAYFEAQYGHVAPAEFVDFASGYWLLVLPIAVDLTLSRHRWTSSELALERGVLAATILFLGYHLFFTLPIMPYKERFFHPAVPALAFLAASAVRRLVDGKGADALRRFPSGLIALVVLVVLAPAGVKAAKALRKERLTGGIGNFDLVRMYRVTSKQDLWFGLDRFSALPDDVVIATTEVGLPAALNPGKRLIDMAGLNDRGFATEGFTTRRLLDDYRPDLVYTPHPHYDRMARALAQDERFERDYEVFPAETLGATLGLALRRSSPHYETMKAIVNDERARRGRTP